MKLQIFDIGGTFDPATVSGQLLESNPHEKAPGATTHKYETTEGNILLTEMDGILHEVSYQTPKLLPWRRRKKNRFLFSGYSPEVDWEEVLDNDFGKSYRSKDDRLFALWSYVMDYNTFGTMEFYGARW